MKYPGIKTCTLREKWEEKRCGSPQMCLLDGNGRSARKPNRMQARRSWNQFKWYHSTPPFSTSPPTPPPFSSSALSASKPFSHSPSQLGLFHCFVRHCRRGREYSMAARSAALLCDFTALYTSECSFYASIIF